MDAAVRRWAPGWWGRGYGVWGALAVLSAFGHGATTAAPLPKDPVERACWERHTRERTRPDRLADTHIAFTNLRSGYTVRSPFVVDFAVRGMGVAPAGVAHAGTGHHHLLINARLPASVTDKLPFSDTYRHFGKGQTSTLVELPPGEHTLRLLFADHDHRPYFLFSPELRVRVAGNRRSLPPSVDPQQLDATCAPWYQEELTRPRPDTEGLRITNLRDGEAVLSPLVLHFGVNSHGVCGASTCPERTGHFVLEVLRDGRLQQSLNLANGATQARLQLPPGAYRLRLRLVDGRSGADLLPPVEHNLPVVGTERM